MMAINRDGHKVYHDGHSNENVKNQWHAFKKSPVMPSSENRFVAFMVVVVMIIVCGRYGL